MATKYDRILWKAHKKLQAPELNEFQSIQNNKIEDAFIAALGASKGVRTLTINPILNGIVLNAKIFAYGRFFDVSNMLIENIFSTTTNSTIILYAKVSEKIITSLDDPSIAIPITKEETAVRIRHNITIESNIILPLDITDQPDGVNVKYVPIVKLTGNKDVVPTIDYTTYPTYPKLDATKDLSYVPVNRAGDTMTNYLTLHDDPTQPKHAATKQYVDSFVQGLDAKASVRVATTGNILLSGLQTIDGITLLANDRVLVKDQTNKKQNGIYVAKTGVWTRSPDANTNSQVTTGMFTFVEEGTLNSGNGYVLTTNMPIVLETSNLEFVQFSGAGQITAGIGLGKNGNEMYLLNTGITPGTYRSVTVDAQGRITKATNPTTAAGYELTDVITTHGGQTINGTLTTNGTFVSKNSITAGGFDFMLGNTDQTTRGNSGLSRALTKDANATLAINYNGDFTNGVRIDGSKVEVVGSMSLKGILSALNSNNYIGVGTATAPTNSQGTIGFVSNGPTGTGGAYIQYNPPASGNGQTANELTISSTNNTALTKLTLQASNITTPGNLEVGGTIKSQGYNVLTTASAANRFSWTGSRISVDNGGNNAAVSFADNATNATNASNADTVDGIHGTSFMRSDTNTSTTGSITANTYYTGNWYRSTGATGWYNQDYGGGIYMEDATWVKVYNNKSFLVNGVIKAVGGFVVPVGANKYSNI